MPSEPKEYRIVSDGNWYRVEESYRTWFRKRLAWRRVEWGGPLMVYSRSHSSLNSAEEELSTIKSRHEWQEVRRDTKGAADAE